MPPRRRRSAGIAQSESPDELPQSLWAQNANHMSLREWARASGSCRTLSRVQLHIVDVPHDFPESGLEWLSNRLSCTSALRVRTSMWQGLADGLGQGLNRLTGLHQLEIMGRIPASGNAGALQLMSFSWMLANAPNLTVLSARLGTLHWFPPLSQLKHLDPIFVRDTGNVFAALPNAKKLETVAIRGDTMDSDLPVLQAPCLRLGMLPYLRAVRLHSIRPRAIHLPEHCSLHLFYFGEEDLSPSRWVGAIPNIRTFDFEDEFMLIYGQLPLFFGTLHNATTVEILVQDLGSEEAYLPLDCLSHVARLCLGGQRVFLQVPANVAWQEVMWTCTRQMGLSFDDPVSFAKTIPKACFKYAYLAGPSLWDLSSAWATFKRSWKAYSANSRTVVECPAECDVRFDECHCGVCMPCLRAAGVVHDWEAA